MKTKIFNSTVAVLAAMSFVACSKNSKDASSETTSLSSKMSLALSSQMKTNNSTPAPTQKVSAQSVILTDQQIDHMIQAADSYITTSSLNASTDAAEILPALVAGFEQAIDEEGFTTNSDKIEVINLLGTSAMAVLVDYSANINTGDLPVGVSPVESAMALLTEELVGNMDEAGIAAADIDTAASALLEDMTSNMDEAGVGATDLSGVLQYLSSGAVEGLNSVSGMDDTNALDCLNAIPNGIISSLDQIEMEGYDSSDLGGIVRDINVGVTGSLDNLTVTGFDSTDLAGALREITEGSTSALDDISMTGYDPTDLPDLVKDISTGASAGIEFITMTDFDSTDYQSLITDISEGAAAGLNLIDQTDFNYDESLAVTNLAEGIGLGLTNVEDANISSTNLETYINAGIASGNTGGDFSDNGYDIDANITSGSMETLPPVENTDPTFDSSTGATPSPTPLAAIKI